MSGDIQNEITGIGSNDWILQAKKCRIDLNETLFQDKNNIKMFLDKYNLPSIKILNLDDIYKRALVNFAKTSCKTPLIREISDFLNDGKINYIRFQPKELSLPKRSKMDLKNIEELVLFINEEKIDISNYDININQNGIMKYSGQIISNNGVIVGEIIQDHCVYLRYGLKSSPLCGRINSYSKILKYINNPPGFSDIIEAKQYLYKAIKEIKGFSDFAINGYFEFFVNHKGVQFYNMQEKGGFVKI